MTPLDIVRYHLTELLDLLEQENIKEAIICCEAALDNLNLLDPNMEDPNDYERVMTSMGVHYPSGELPEDDEDEDRCSTMHLGVW